MNSLDQNNGLLSSLERDLNCSTEWKKVAIPKGLPALLEIFAKEVIRENPENIYEFLYNLAENLLAKREDEEGGQKRGRVNQDDESATTKETYNPFSEDLAAAKIQAGFRGYQTRKSLKNSKKGAEGDLEASSPSELLKTINEWNGEDKDENENVEKEEKKGSVSFFTDADAKALLETIKEESVEVGSVSALASVPAETLNKISSSHMDAIPTADVLLLTDIEDEIMKIQIVQSQTDGADDENEQETSSEENKLQTDTETLPNTQAEAEDVVTELEEELAEIMCPGTSVNVTLPTTSSDDGHQNSADQSQTDNDELETGETCEQQETAIMTDDQKKTETESETSQINPDTDDVETQLGNENNNLEEVDESENINNEENVETPVDVDSEPKDISSPLDEANADETNENIEQEEEVIEEIKVTKHRDVAREANLLDDSDSESHQDAKNGELDTIVVEAEIHNENSLEEDGVNEVTNQDANEVCDDNVETADAVVHEESTENNSIENAMDESLDLDPASKENSKEIDESEVDTNQEDSEKLKSRPNSAKSNQDGEKSETRPSSATETQEKSESRPNSAKENQEGEEKSGSRPTSAKETQEDEEKPDSRPSSAKEPQVDVEKSVSRPTSAKETQDDDEKSDSRPTSAKDTQEDAEKSESRPASAKKIQDDEAKSESRPASAKDATEDAEKSESRPASAKEIQDDEVKSESRPASAKDATENAEKSESRPASAKDATENAEKSESRPASAKNATEDAEKSESRPASAKNATEDAEKSESRPASAKDATEDAEKSESRPASAKDATEDAEESESRPASSKDATEDAEKSESRPASAKDSTEDAEESESRPTSAKEIQEETKLNSRPVSAKEPPEDEEKADGRPISAKETLGDEEKSDSRPISAKEPSKDEKSDSRPISAKEAPDNEEKSDSRPISANETPEDEEKSDSRPVSAKEIQEDEDKSDGRPVSAKETSEDTNKLENRPPSAKENQEDSEKSGSRPSSAKETQDVEKSESRPTSAKEDGTLESQSRPSSAKEDQQIEVKSESRPNSATKGQDGDGKSESRPSSVKNVQEDNKNSESRPNSSKENDGLSSENGVTENEREKSVKERWKESFEKVNSVMSIADDEDIQFIDEETEVAKPSNDNQSDVPTNNCDESQISNKLTRNESSQAASPVSESKEDTSSPAPATPQPTPVTPEPITQPATPPVARTRHLIYKSNNTPTPTETTPLVPAQEEPEFDPPKLRRTGSGRRNRPSAGSKYRSGFVMEDSMSLHDMEAEIEKEVLNEAATKIQAGFRGFQTRKSLHGLARVSIENEDSSDGLKDPQANNSVEAESAPAETSEIVAIDNAALSASAEPNADALPENNVIVADASAENVNLPINDEKTESEDIVSDLPAESDKPVSETVEAVEDASSTEAAAPVTETKEITRMPLAYLRSRSYPGSAEEDLPEEEEELGDDVEMVAIGKVGEIVEGDENDNISVDLDLDEGYINNAATKIQANIRGFLVRKSLKRKGKGRKASQEGSNDKTEATDEGADDGGVEEDITDCNSNMDNVTNQEIDDTTQVAATKIQAGFRGFKDRQKIRQKKQAAVTIQATVRGFLTRRRLAKARRKSLQRRRSSAKSISNDLQSLQKANLAATKIQSMYRGYQVRSKLNQNISKSAGDE